MARISGSGETMSAFLDLTNQVFERLTVLRLVRRDKRGKAIWLCSCSCDGKEIEVSGDSLVSGHAGSCGCLKRERMADANFKHGHSRASSARNPTYRSWESMKRRCFCPAYRGWKNYGGRGIGVRDRWTGAQGFENFLADMGERPTGTTLGRFGDIGNYEPENCAWQTDREQKTEQKNKRHLAFLAG